MGLVKIVKILTKQDLIQLKNLDVLLIKSAPVDKTIIVSDMGILSKIPTYDPELYNDILDVDYYELVQNS